MVQDGVLTRKSEIRVIRDGAVIHTGKVEGLKRFKDDASEVRAGFECGVSLANFNDLKSGDTLEAAVFAMEELEETAKLYLLLRGLNPRYLSPEQVADLKKVFGLTLPEHGHD